MVGIYFNNLKKKKLRVGRVSNLAGNLQCSVLYTTHGHVHYREKKERKKHVVFILKYHINSAIVQEPVKYDTSFFFFFKYYLPWVPTVLFVYL